MLRKLCLLAALSAFLLGHSAIAGTFGKVVSIGGHASDVALDEPRGVLYVADFTANRIEVMSLAKKTIQTALNVMPQPYSISISPDGHWLLVAHYGNVASPGSPANALTLIDLSNNYAKQTFTLPDPPLGLAFGSDNRALIVTTQNFLIFDPSLGTTKVLISIADQVVKTIPQPPQSFPQNIVAASVGASADGNWIYGFGDSLIFRYYVPFGALNSTAYGATPPLGPRAVSVAQDGSYAAMGWIMTDQQGRQFAEFPNPLGTLNVGGHAVDSVAGLVYSEVQQALTDPPVLTVRAADNLTLIDSLQLPEHLAGRAVLSSDRQTMYASSASGVLVLPVGNLNASPRLSASTEDLVFSGSFCDRTLATKTFTLSDPGGAKVPFTIKSSNSAVSVSPSSGTTPAVITVRVDPNAFADQQGTAAVQLTFTSTTAVNLPKNVRILVNSREPNQRGTFINVPGTLVDIASNPTKDEYYVLRQDLNEVLVFNGTNNTQKIAPLRTCTKPMSMTITYDRTRLLVGCDNSHIISVFDLSTLTPLDPVYAPRSYVQSIASSAKATLALMRDGGGEQPQIHSVDLNSLTTSKYTRLGVYDNTLPLNTVLAPAPNGSSIMAASADGSVMLYDATVDTFTISRKDFTSLVGAYAASSFGQYVIGNMIFDSSLVQTATIQPTTGLSSGFTFVGQNGFFISAPDAASPGVLARVNASDGTAMLPTGVVEAPVLGTEAAAFTRSLVMLPSGSEIVAMTTSGITILPPQYDALVAAPLITGAVSAADLKSPVAAGGLMAVLGMNLSGSNIATSEVPLPTVIGDSCLTVNGAPTHMLFVSPTQVNAQMPAQASGNVALVMHTPGGVSNTFFLTVGTAAPSVFLTTIDGASNVPAIVRYANGLVVTATNPVHRGDILSIYLTGLGEVNPPVNDGDAGSVDPLSTTVITPVVQIGGQNAPVLFSGLVPGVPGAYVLNISVPGSTPQGLGVPLTITVNDITFTQNVRVVQK
ncbi:MAG: hypothetical protein ACRD4E_14925 [Bryobacteraceae bacterium]